MKQCAARQFENELVERLSILANRHLRPPAPERGPHSGPILANVTIVLPFAFWHAWQAHPSLG
jgi:hypothetical protein